MMDYLKMNYIYPPRAERKIHPATLDQWENFGYGAQAKLNGDCTVLFLKGELSSLWNRHGKPYTKVQDIGLDKLSRGSGWTVLAGEYMAKSKCNGLGEVWNNKFVIWDILVNEDKYLIGQTFRQRVELLDRMYGHEPYLEGTTNGIYLDRNIFQVEDDIFRSATFGGDFKDIYDSITPIDMYEGLVLKQFDSALAYGGSEANNSAWQIKARKQTKNYAF